MWQLNSHQKSDKYKFIEMNMLIHGNQDAMLMLWKERDIFYTCESVIT